MKERGPPPLGNIILVEEAPFEFIAAVTRMYQFKKF
jgi:hypothetical protein